MDEATWPTRDAIIGMVADRIYSSRILNNSHRGDVVEMMVLAALGPEWQFVGLGWHPWDLQRGTGNNRIRIQVKQSAALQIWGPTKRQFASFGWSKKSPSSFAEYNPGELIESEGWFCEVFVIGIHSNDDVEATDQVDPKQWRFLVIPAAELPRGCNSMVLSRALKLWPAIEWAQINDAVQTAIDSCAQNKRSEDV